MRYSRFDLGLLNALDALLTERSVTKAADRLFVTQPSMSGTLQRLRDHFGDPLLVRAGREMELTPKAAALAGPVRELVLQAKATLALDADFDPATAKRTFRLIMSDYVSVVFAHPLLKRVGREAPGIRLHIEPLTRGCFARVAGGEADMCVTTDKFRLFRAEDVTDMLRVEPLFADRFVCAVAADHPGIGDALGLEDYLTLPHVLTRFGDGVATIAEHVLQGSDFDLTVGAASPGFLAPLFMLPGTRLIATVQKTLADRVAGAVALRTFAPPIDIPDLHEVVTWHSRSDLDPGHLWLREAMREAAKEVGAPAA